MPLWFWAAFRFCVSHTVPLFFFSFFQMSFMKPGCQIPLKRRVMTLWDLTLPAVGAVTPTTPSVGPAADWSPCKTDSAAEGNCQPQNHGKRQVLCLFALRDEDRRRSPREEDGDGLQESTATLSLWPASRGLGSTAAGIWILPVSQVSRKWTLA